MASDEGGLKDLEVPIQVSEDLRKPHPLVKRSAEILQPIKPDDRGIVIHRREHCLDIQVSKNSLRRALLIMDTLAKAPLKGRKTSKTLLNTFPEK